MNNAKPTLLFIPGLLSENIVWRGVQDNIETNLPSTYVDVSSVQDLRDFAQHTLDSIAGPVIPVGHSMGGRIAFEILRLSPERVPAMIIANSGVHSRKDGESLARQVMIDLAYDQGMTALADTWLPPMVHASRRGNNPLMHELRQMVERATPQQHERQMKALLNRPAAHLGLEKITCPVLLLVGRTDEWAPVEQHETIRDKIISAELAVVENAGHFAPIEQPQVVGRIINNWLKKLEF